jgi:superfamily II DNA/RNA helicase
VSVVFRIWENELKKQRKKKKKEEKKRRKEKKKKKKKKKEEKERRKRKKKKKEEKERRKRKKKKKEEKTNERKRESEKKSQTSQTETLPRRIPPALTIHPLCNAHKSSLAVRGESLPSLFFMGENSSVRATSITKQFFAYGNTSNTNNFVGIFDEEKNKQK